MEKTIFAGTGEDEQPFFIIERARLRENNYLLVTDQETGDGDCYIMKEVSGGADGEAVYEFVEDDGELEAVGKLFEELLDDVTII